MNMYVVCSTEVSSAGGASATLKMASHSSCIVLWIIARGKSLWSVPKGSVISKASSRKPR